MAGTISSDPIGLTDDQKLKTEALIDYIATTPQNINYNIFREIIKATILDENHPYFTYYEEKISQTEEPSEGLGEKDSPLEPNPGSGGSSQK